MNKTQYASKVLAESSAGLWAVERRERSANASAATDGYAGDAGFLGSRPIR
jgi:hypothetical protein